MSFFGFFYHFLKLNLHYSECSYYCIHKNVYKCIGRPHIVVVMSPVGRPHTIDTIA